MLVGVSPDDVGVVEEAYECVEVLVGLGLRSPQVRGHALDDTGVVVGMIDDSEVPLISHHGVEIGLGEARRVEVVVQDARADGAGVVRELDGERGEVAVSDPLVGLFRLLQDVFARRQEEPSRRGLACQPGDRDDGLVLVLLQRGVRRRPAEEVVVVEDLLPFRVEERESVLDVPILSLSLQP